MYLFRSCLFCLLAVLAFTPPASARRRPPHGKKHRAPPAPEPDMPVRKPAEIGGFEPAQGEPGTDVEIRGDNFDQTVRVRFNGRWIKAVNPSAKVVKVRIPNNAVTDRFVVNKAGFPDVLADNEFVVIRTPVILRHAPRRGAAGTEVVVFGSAFIPSDEFVVGQVEVPVVRRRHDKVVIQTTEGVSTGRIGVKRGGNVVAWSHDAFDVLAPPPVIQSFAPTRGERGTSVHITGRNFEPTDRVELSGKPVPIRGRGPNHLDVVVTPHSSSGHFVVLGRMGRRIESPGTFAVIRPPRIAGFAPRFGPPGTRLTLEGEGFAEGDQVFIGGAMLTVRTINDRRIVAEVPAGVSSGPVFVQRAGRRYHVKGAFEVILPPMITEFGPRPASPGATVEIQGRNFLADASVLLAGAQLKIVARKLPTMLRVMLPPNARTGQLVVVTRAGSTRSAIPLHIAQRAELSSFFPLHGLPGSRFTLRGSHFHPKMRVVLGNLELPVIKVEPETAEVQIPKEAKPGPQPVAIETFGQRVTSNLRFTVDQPTPEIEFTFAPTSGRRGSEVTLLLTPPQQSVMVFFDGRPLPKKVIQGGQQLVVTIPGDARSGYFELEHRGERYRAKQIFRVR